LFIIYIGKIILSSVSAQSPQPCQPHLGACLQLEKHIHLNAQFNIMLHFFGKNNFSCFLRGFRIISSQSLITSPVTNPWIKNRGNVLKWH